MKKNMSILMMLLCCWMGSTRLQAEDIVAVDTVRLVYPEVKPEPDPNNSTYIFTFKGEDETGQNWQVQIMYTAPQMYGTFRDGDFYNLGNSASGSYNYIRTEDGMSFFPFKHLTAAVVDYTDSTVIDVNGLCKNKNDVWERVLIHATLATPDPKDTIRTDLGRVAAIPNKLYESLYLEAENEEYKLAFGVGGALALQAGTYYTVDLLKPQFVHQADNDSIETASAKLTVRDTTDGHFALTLNLISEDNILYVLDMHTGNVEITDTVVVDCLSGNMSEQADFDMFQIYGEGKDYNVAVSVTRSTIRNGLQEIPGDSILLSYTGVANRADLQTIRIEEAEAYIEDTQEADKKTFRANLTGINGTLYKVSIPLGYSYLPDAKDTIDIDFGTGVGRVDYSQGLGMIGFVLADDGDIDVHVSAYCGMKLDGTIYSDKFDYDGCYLTFYLKEGWRHMDIKSAQMSLDSVGDVLHITLDAIAINDTMYHMTARLLPKYALTGSRVAYSTNLSDGVSMIALATDDAVYRMQLQRADQWTEDGEPLGDYELWEFCFYQPTPNTIAGTYGYSAGNLDISRRMVLSEDGTEIYLAPYAGTLTLTSGEELSLEIYGQTYKTHYYGIAAEVLAENGIIYELQGECFLLCFDGETGKLVEVSEDLTALNDALQEHGFVVRKVLRDGQLLIERCEGTYNMQGSRLE